MPSRSPSTSSTADPCHPGLIRLRCTGSPRIKGINHRTAQGPGPRRHPVSSATSNTAKDLTLADLARKLTTPSHLRNRRDFDAPRNIKGIDLDGSYVAQQTSRLLAVRLVPDYPAPGRLEAGAGAQRNVVLDVSLSKHAGRPARHRNSGATTSTRVQLPVTVVHRLRSSCTLHR